MPFYEELLAICKNIVLLQIDYCTVNMQTLLFEGQCFSLVQFGSAWFSLVKLGSVWFSLVQFKELKISM